MTEEFRARVADICRTFPGATVSDPWGGGHDAWKVGDKMFACIGAMQKGVAVKCADIETATMLKEAGIGSNAPYFHKSWILLPQDCAEDELRHRIAASYAIIRSKLPAAIRRNLPISSGGAA